MAKALRYRVAVELHSGSFVLLDGFLSASHNLRYSI